jgi:methionine sulfoxide reductase heme-binding subunit
MRGSTCGGTSDVTEPSERVWLKPGVLVGALIPLAVLIYDAARGKLGADPVAIALNRLGLLALIMLVACLAATPLRILWGVTWGLRMRRMLGLLAFFYASLHFLVYLAVDQGFALGAIAEDIVKRWFIAAGFLALLSLLPLAGTSSHAARRWLGARRWQRLHRLIYPAALFAVLHFVWRVKRDLSQPVIYAAIVVLLLGIRVYERKRRRARREALYGARPG